MRVMKRRVSPVRLTTTNNKRTQMMKMISSKRNSNLKVNFKERGDNGLFITLVPKVL